MRRLITLILLSAAFLGGYYLGHRPDSPDIFAKAGQAYRRLTSTTNDVASRAEEQDSTLPKAAISYLLEPTPETPQSQDSRQQ